MSLTSTYMGTFDPSITEEFETEMEFFLNYLWSRKDYYKQNSVRTVVGGKVVDQMQPVKDLTRRASLVLKNDPTGIANKLAVNVD